jgi:7-cyano-7-deazaguanine reductase
VSDTHDKGPLLGRHVSGSNRYDPSLLHPVPRANARRQLAEPGFDGHGEDIWQCYELGWLDGAGSPVVRMGFLSVPADSPQLVESKSLKLYLNSLNGHGFDSDAAASDCIESDLSAVAGAAVKLELLPVEAPSFDGGSPAGDSLDIYSVPAPAEPDADLLRPGEDDSALLYTHRVRSLCPVTAQPDWATVAIETRGVAPERAGLMAYLLGYRQHQEFHEHCAERIYADLRDRLEPEFLSVHALYTRRGGLAICPWRCSEPIAAPRYRLNRQ